jgi:tripartite-type tricarboxylate transporter receptor subunit TctC
MVTRRRFVASSLAALALPVGRASAQGGEYPSRPIRLIVPLPPGGSPDYLSRILSERLPPVLGQPVVVENKPGAGGNIAREYVARSPADGYTLIMSESGHVLSASMLPKLSYDPIKDFEPICYAANIPFVLTVNAGVPAQTMPEFIALAKAKPGTLTYGSAGIGAPHHFAGELLKSMAGIDIVHVPYKGSAGIIPALLSGEISFTIGAINSLLPHYRTGKLRPIALAGTTRTPVMPELPTIAEAGPLPGYAMEVWLGVMAPAGTPRPIIERLNNEINKIVRDPQVIKEKLLPVGLDPMGSTPEQLRELMRSDLAKFTKVARDANMKPE